MQAFLRLVCVYAGEAAIAIAALAKAMALSPHYPAWYTYNMTLAHLWAGDLASAEAAADAYLEREPDEPFSYTNLATVYGFQGRREDAALVISRLRARVPGFGFAQFLPSQRYKERARLDRIADVMRQAGLPG